MKLSCDSLVVVGCEYSCEQNLQRMAEAGPPGGTVELRRTGHDDLLRDTIKELAQVSQAHLNHITQSLCQLQPLLIACHVMVLNLKLKPNFEEAPNQPPCPARGLLERDGVLQRRHARPQQAHRGAHLPPTTGRDLGHMSGGFGSTIM